MKIFKKKYWLAQHLMSIDVPEIDWTWNPLDEWDIEIYVMNNIKRNYIAQTFKIAFVYSYFS